MPERRMYTPNDARRVVAVFKERCTGRANAVSPKEFASYFTGQISERAVRQIIADRDGKDYVLSNEGRNCMFVCEDAFDADVTTRILQARAETELERVHRRRLFAASELPAQTVMALGVRQEA